MRKATFDFKMGRAEGEIVRVNDKTIRVQFDVKGQTIVIPRHIEKHRVEFVGEE
jgi:hypothetical protein